MNQLRCDGYLPHSHQTEVWYVFKRWRPRGQPPGTPPLLNDSDLLCHKSYAVVAENSFTNR